MSEHALSPVTAPRNPEALANETAFKLRMLVQALNGLDTDEQKMAWHNLVTKEARGEYTFRLLQEWDAKNPGQSMAAPAQQAPQQAPPQQQFQPPPQQQQPAPQQGFQPQFGGQPGFQNGAPQQNGFAGNNGVPQGGFQPQFGGGQQFNGAPQQNFQQPGFVQNQQPVGPAAVNQQAQQAATEATGKSTRSPRTSKATNGVAEGDAELGGKVLSMLQAIAAQQQAADARIEKFEKHLGTLLEEAASNKGSRVTALEEKYNEVANTLQHISGALQSQSQLQIWTLTAFLTFMQESMGHSTKDILAAAIQDSALFSKLVDQATGKA